MTDYLRAPDRNPLIAPQADFAKMVKDFLNKYETKKLGKIDSPWNKYGAGNSFGDLLFGQSPELLDDKKGWHNLHWVTYGKMYLTTKFCQKLKVFVLVAQMILQESILNFQKSLTMFKFINLMLTD
jgi:hypothetical protein